MTSHQAGLHCSLRVQTFGLVVFPFQPSNGNAVKILGECWHSPDHSALGRCMQANTSDDTRTSTGSDPFVQECGDKQTNQQKNQHARKFQLGNVGRFCATSSRCLALRIQRLDLYCPYNVNVTKISHLEIPDQQDIGIIGWTTRTQNSCLWKALDESRVRRLKVDFLWTCYRILDPTVWQYLRSIRTEVHTGITRQRCQR